MNSKLKFPSAMCIPLEALMKLEDYCWAADFTEVLDCNILLLIFLKDLMLESLSYGMSH